MQEIPLGVHAVLVAIIFWRMWHLLRTLLVGKVSERDLIEVGIDGLALGLLGGVLTGSGMAAAAFAGLGAGAVFYVLAMFGLATKGEPEPTKRRQDLEESKE